MEWFFSSAFDLNQLEEFRYSHMTVNHSEQFVNPVTFAHTNTIEGHWGNLKVLIRQKHGLSMDLKQQYLDYYMWKSRILEEENAFDVILDDIYRFYNHFID